MRISKQLYSDLETHSANDWDCETADELLRLYPSYFAALDVKKSQVVAMCSIVRDQVGHLNIRERKHVFKMIVSALDLGAYFLHDPRYEAVVNSSLRLPSMPTDRRVVLFVEHTQRIMAALDQPNRFKRLNKQLQNALSQSMPQGDDRHLSALLSGILDQRQDIRREEHSRIVAAFLHQCDIYQLKAYFHKAAYCICAITNGPYWFDDPLFEKIRAGFNPIHKQDDLLDSLSSVYQRFM